MQRTFVRIASLAGLLSLSAIGHTQALPTATGHGGMQVGLGWTFVEPDYAQKAIQGFTIFSDLDVVPHIGAEAEYHYIALKTPTDFAENSFFAGPRFMLPRGRFKIYGKALIGIGDIVFQENNPGNGGGTYFAYGAGGGIDYKINQHWVARADFEYQHWAYLTGLTPTAFTVGAAYRFR
jgi:hypothetical protein